MRTKAKIRDEGEYRVLAASRILPKDSVEAALCRQGRSGSGGTTPAGRCEPKRLLKNLHVALPV